MKKYHLILLSCLFLIGFSNCSDNENEFSEPVELRLKQSKTTIAPFEKLVVSIDLDSDLLWNNYDSIAFKNNGTWWNGIITFPNTDDVRDHNITDYRLGKNKVYAIGYKDGIVKSEAEIEYNVEKPTKDFFTINWKRGIKEETNYYQTYKRVSTDDGSLRWEGMYITVSHLLDTYKKTDEYATLEITPASISIFRGISYSEPLKTRGNNILLPDIDNYNFIRYPFSNDKERWKEEWLMHRSFWHSYVTLIYGESTFKYDGDDVKKTTLWEEYNKRFKNSLENVHCGGRDTYPIEIWVTPSSYICMFAHAQGPSYVIAEPR